ncbi:hypothetical protein [Donghicola mangrovi]|uniref:Fungal lipase-like domain-containing protein n=1 Tax=Donghicola mangrovi TaxID=2729614 RepID=A0A850Q5V2_9RHOB|nr:hypothetical protein [Donghicola mangrovi]NVO24333.1 hypothetical protein [Donghicola mangrovi]
MSASGNALDRAISLSIAGTFSHVVYGEDRLPAAYRGKGDGGMDDDYSGYLAKSAWTVLTPKLSGSTGTYAKGGLYSGDIGSGDFDAQALVAETTLKDGTKVLVLTFRGTDDTLNAIKGQTFTKSGLQAYYDGFSALLDAVVAYANKASNGIDAVVVTGHSLGGSMVDLFMMQDRSRFSDKLDVQAVAVGSAGLVSSLVKNVDLTGYTAVANDGDLVVDPTLKNSWLATQVLRANVHIGDDLVFEMQNLNSVPSGSSVYSVTYPVGLQHESKLYSENLIALGTDPLAGFFKGDRVIMGNGIDADGDNVEATGTDKDDPSADDKGSRALTGTNGTDYIIGREGNDALLGRGGADLLSGGKGKDTLKGGDGADRLDGGSSNDQLWGEGGNDRLWGGDGNDRISGGGGNDSAAGGDGKDQLYGGTGKDVLKGGAGADKLYGGDGNDALGGEGGADLLFGNRGNDILRGGDYRDTLVGGEGNDTLVGDTGPDVFVFSAGDGRDVIRDFELGMDRLSFDGLKARDLHLSYSGDDTVIRADGLQITLNGVHLDGLDSADPLFG